MPGPTLPPDVFAKFAVRQPKPFLGDRFAIAVPSRMSPSGAIHESFPRMIRS